MTERRRRNRPLSDAEIALWVSVAQSVVPRVGATLPQPKPAPTPVPAPPPPAAPEPRRYAVADYTPPTARKAAVAPLAPFEKRFRRQVTRGQVDIAAAIDLHGMTQAEAHGALVGFLYGAHRQGARLVLVVTGKGRARASLAPGAHEAERGILRRAVPLWLRSETLRGLVLGFEEAGLPHGGMGALYVRLRRGA